MSNHNKRQTKNYEGKKRAKTKQKRDERIDQILNESETPKKDE